MGSMAEEFIDMICNYSFRFFANQKPQMLRPRAAIKPKTEIRTGTSHVPIRTGHQKSSLIRWNRETSPNIIPVMRKYNLFFIIYII
ncbi:hypothetical protein BMS3Abin07_01087 [bacterium BMS3Abin07]|nr:hypothetical protein BMS3Abin07_01087 [bacterium BMS3Abin07]GBE31920.1 hypothetical protein BMS3Bbin05_00824 [bacterium BMS3Bbin05]